MSVPARREVLLLEIGGQRYGLPTSDVQEVLRAVTVVPLPKAPRIVLGVIDVRGTIVPVLDIRTRFRLPAREVRESDHFVVGSAGERLVAICADRALDLKQVDALDVEEATRAVPGAEYVAGIAKLPDGLVLIHDLRSFLSQAESEQLSEALSVPEEEQA